MKPKPFSSLNHLTVPLGMWRDPPCLKCCYGGCPPGACTCCLCRPASRTALRAGKVQDVEDPMSIGRNVKVPLREIVLRTSRSSGPGGQHANVTASRIEAVFDVESSEALSEAQKRRVIARLGPRVTAVAQDARSQARNRELALERLRERLTDALAVPRRRRATQPTPASVRERLESKRRQATRKRERQPPRGDE